MKNQSACTLCTSSARTAAATPSAAIVSADHALQVPTEARLQQPRALFQLNIEPADRIDDEKLDVTAPTMAARPSMPTSGGVT